MTKNQMARIIVTALYNRPALVRPDLPEVVRRAKHGRVAALAYQCEMAIAAIRSGPHAHLVEGL